VCLPFCFGAAERLAVTSGQTVVHPFDDPLVIAGHGTIGLEILSQLKERRQRDFAHLLDSGRRCGRCAARHCRTEVGCGGCAHGTHPPAAVPSEYSLGPACRLDAIFCCVGGGGLVSGIAAYVKSVRPDVR
jgi:threonine dehydratase